MRSDYAELGFWIREARVEAGLSQDQVGQALGCRQETVSGWERGKPIDDRNLRAFAELVGRDPAEALRLRARLQAVREYRRASECYADAASRLAGYVAEGTGEYRTLGDWQDALVPLLALLPDQDRERVVKMAEEQAKQGREESRTDE